MLRDRVRDKPGAAANRRKHVSVFGWAVEKSDTKVKSNPMRDVKPLKSNSTGFHAWSMDDLGKFEKRHPIGTKARLAMGLLLFLGPRRQDMVSFGKQMVKDGVMAMFDWSSPRIAMRYIEAANKKKLAEQGMGLIASAHTLNATVAHPIGPPRNIKSSQ
jgi:hypothetical protein